MSKTGAWVSSQWYQDKRHREAVFRKLEKVQGLQALLDEWEAQPEDSDEYRAYLLHLRERVRQARNQYECMKP